MNSTSSIHLLHVFPTFGVGGAQMRFAQLVEAHGQRYRHTVIALDGVTEMAARIPNDVAISYRSVNFNKHNTLLNVLLFRRLLREIRPDVLVTYNWGAIEWALANRTGKRWRHVHIEDGFGRDEAHRQLRRRVWTRRLALSGRCTQVVLPSRALERTALTIWRLAPTHVRYVPNGVDIARFSVDIAERTERPPPAVVGTVATLRAEKNIQRLLLAFNAVALDQPAAVLVIVGEGPERLSLEAYASGLAAHGQIRFVGASASPQDWYRKMDVFALSSDTEQMPLSVLEAMAAGLPLVSTAVGDVPELVASENAAQIVPLGDDVAYRNALAGLLSDEPLRTKIGKANQNRVRQFSLSVMVERYAELFG